jgi:hypothetical protein
MGQAFSELFDSLVIRYFGLLAKRIGLSLRTLADGAYEIAGKSFLMRIRRGTGHLPSVLVTISETKGRPQDVRDLTGEVGLSVIASFNGVDLPKGEGRLQDMDAIVAQLATFAEKFGVPYLKEEKQSLAEIREFIENKIREKGIRDKKYNFPKNVREEWI